MAKKKRLLWASVALLFLFAGASAAWWLNRDSSNDTAKTPGSSETPETPSKDTDDKIPPTVSINEDGLAKPLSGMVTITVKTQDNTSVSHVEYYIDNEFFAVSYASPFSLELNTAQLTAGKHTLVAKAYDGAGNHTSSRAVTLTISEQVAVDTSQPTGTGSDKADTGADTDNGKDDSDTGSGGSHGGGSPGGTSDVTPPSAPDNVVLSADSAYVLTASWDASTDDTLVDGYKVYRDGTLLGTSDTASYTDYTVVPGNTYDYYVVAYDSAGNTSAGSAEPSATMEPTSIWMPFDRPATFGNDGVPLELGVKFQPRVDGKISGVRFYKASGETGTHEGTLWEANGTPITSAVSSGESASGWQEISFATPVDVTADTTYVVSYTSNGRYGATTDYFETQGITSEYLEAPISGGPDGNNGVFSVSGGSFPTSSFDQSNYWVDVTFAPNPEAGGPTPTLVDSDEIYPDYPGSDNTGVVGQRLPRRDRIDLVAGMTVSDVEIRSDFVAVKVNNVTFDNVKITYSGPLDGSFTLVNIQVGVTGTTFTDCEVDGQSKVERAIYGIAEVNVQRCNIHHSANAIEVSNKITAHDNYIHDIFTPSGMIWHADGIQTASTANDLSIVHNTIFLTNGETGAVNFVGSGPGSGDSMTNVLVDNNLMAGGSYTVYVGADTNTNVRVTNNKFSTRYYPKVGAFNIHYPTFLSGVVVTGNTIYETGEPADSNL